MTVNRRFVALLFFVVFSFVSAGHAAEVSLSASVPDERGWVRLESPGRSNSVHVLEASTDLHTWREAAVLHDGPIRFLDVSTPLRATRYFRLISRIKTAADDGKNLVTLPDDPFANEPADPFAFPEPRIRWIKFAILRGDETRVWFQDSTKYAFHYDFARLRLEPFHGFSRAEFDRRTLFRTNQLAVLGAVLIAPEAAGTEFGIQFVGQDAFDREDIARWYELVRAGVQLPTGTRAFYIPTLEQSEVAELNRIWLSERGVDLASADRWLTHDASYSDGWAVGRLAFVPAAQIVAAYADGRLRPTDILLTDAVPAEVPVVAGIITLTPATPNSHVAILARGYGVPFVWFADPLVRSNLVSWSGREVALRTGADQAGVQVLDLAGQLTPELREAFQALKRLPVLRYTSKQRAGFYATNVQNLVPADARFVGGKASNYGLLRRVIPERSQPAIAFTFDLWDGFLDQILPSGKSLRAQLQTQLGGFTYPPPVAELRIQLAAVRDLFTSTAAFSPPLRQAVLGALTNAGFDGTRKIRFRSSTNVEDSEDFTGAGLYDSFSGCLADDLDDDSAGPSHCDAEESQERGVFRAIQRVYASFYNENAFLERLRRGVNEAEVGMAVLVHHSFPDVDELANGVATLKYSRAFGSENFEGEFVTQLGAESVSNPDSAARPEVVALYRSSDFTSLALRQASSLVPLGAHVMTWEGDYQSLANLLTQVAKGYAGLFPNQASFTLDFEYKRMRPGSLDIKQVRPLPEPKPAPPVTTFLLNEPVSWQVLEGELGEPMAKHRAKSELRLETDTRRLDSTGLRTSFYRASEFCFRAGTDWVCLTNGTVGWPGATFTVEAEAVVDRWTWGAGADRRTFALRTSVIREVMPPTAPWVTQGDFPHALSITYPTAQPSFGWEGPGRTTLDEVMLVPHAVINERSLLQNRSAQNAAGSLRLQTRFYWPEPPSGPSAGYTAPNVGFVESRVEGLLTSPLVLRSPAAQTYSPGHHNFSETFVLEPRLDAEVPTEQVAALEALAIRHLVVTLNEGKAQFGAFDAAGIYRDLK